MDPMRLSNSGGAVLRALFHRYIPSELYGQRTAFGTLARIDGRLSANGPTGDTLRVLEGAKGELIGDLRRRFESPEAEALAVKILNLFLARHHQHSRSATVLSRPFGLVVDTSNTCQLACPGCVHSPRNEALQLFDWPNGTLSEDRFKALLKLYGPYAVGAYFCNYGEPLLNLRTPKFIRLAKTYLMRTALSTSLSVRKFDAAAYVESGLDFMVMSIDGATQPVYERFRRNGNLELVLNNVRQLVAAKRLLGRRTPVLSWNFLAFAHNVHEIPLAKRMARELGVNEFRIVNPFDVGWDDPDFQPAAVQGAVHRLDALSYGSESGNWNPFPESVDEEAMRSAFATPWELPAGAENEQGKGGHTCHWLYKNVVMDATGRILPCCGGPKTGANLVFDRIDGGGDVFNSEKYRQARSWFAGGAAGTGNDPYCTRCDWDQTAVNIGGPEIRRFFLAADAAYFDRRSLGLLSNW